MTQQFEDLQVWQRSFDLTAEVYKSFERCRDYGFKDQITKSALSVPSNISEGFERNSNREFIHFLEIAKGSCGELRTQLRPAVRIGHLPEKDGGNLVLQAETISAMIAGLIKARASF